MDVTRRYYESHDEFVKALGRNSHRRRHLPFWNLALSALMNTENGASAGSALGGVPTSDLSGVTSGMVQTSVAESSEGISAAGFGRATAASSSGFTGRVVFITFHTSPHSHVAPMRVPSIDGKLPQSTDDVLVASALFSPSLIVLFCADDTLDNLVAGWVFAEIVAAHRSRGNTGPNTSTGQQQQSAPPATSAAPERRTVVATPGLPKSYPTLPASIRLMRFSDRVSLYGSLAHVRALLDLASAYARDPKFDVFTSSADGLPGGRRRFIPTEYRMSRDDSGMRVLGRDLRASTRPSASEFALGPTIFKRRTRNAYRLFFIATERLEAIDRAYADAMIGVTATGPGAKVNPLDASKLSLDAQKSLRLATPSDWDAIKTILRREQPEAENNADGEDDGDFDTVLEALQKGNVYVWEAARPSPKTGKTGKAKIRCFAVLEFHTRPLPELSCVEVVDLHLSHSRRDTESARMLMESLSRKFLTTTVLAPAPYHFLYVKVDISVPESSDQFLLDCGFVADAVADFVTLETVHANNARRASSPRDPYEITRVVKVSPATEKPFSAYEIRVLETNELVRKRYREFDKLYFQLKAHFPSLNVPKLPKKKLFGNMEDAFVEKRRSQLQQWLNSIASLPGVEESGWVANFLWTDLKIRGVKQVSEEEKLFRTLQKQSDEAKANAQQQANLASSSSSSQAWPGNSSSSSTAATAPQGTTKTKTASPKEKKERRLSQ